MPPDAAQSQEAREALELIGDMERAGARAAATPRWFVFLLAALLGALFATQESGINVLVLLALVLVTGVRQRTLLAHRRRADPLAHPGWLAAGFAVAVVLIALIVGADIAADRYDLAWARPAVGLFAGAGLVGLHEWGRAQRRAQAAGGAE